MGDPRDDERSFDEVTELEINVDDADLIGLQKLDENGDPIEDDEKDTDESDEELDEKDG